MNGGLVLRSMGVGFVNSISLQISEIGAADRVTHLRAPVPSMNATSGITRKTIGWRRTVARLPIFRNAGSLRGSASPAVDRSSDDGEAAAIGWKRQTPPVRRPSRQSSAETDWAD
jgi:hypothetical protein